MKQDRPLRICYDGVIYGWYSKRTGGITRYFDALISHLPPDTQILLTSSRSPLPSHPQHPGLQILHANPCRRPARLFRKFETIRSIRSEALFKADLNHPTYYVAPRLIKNRLCKPPLVYTVYDMIHEIFSAQEDPDGQFVAEKKSALIRLTCFCALVSRPARTCCVCIPTWRLAAGSFTWGGRSNMRGRATDLSK